jgi:multicomponent Na+:H+ antiporter subunit E
LSSLFVFFLLFSIYLALSGSLVFSNLVIAALVAGGIMSLLKMGQRPDRIQRLPESIITMLEYLGLLLYDILANGIQVAKLVLSREINISPGIVGVQCGKHSDIITGLSAHAMTITPGEMVIAIDEQDVIYVHVLNTHGADERLVKTLRRHRRMLRVILGEEKDVVE